MWSCWLVFVVYAFRLVALVYRFSAGLLDGRRGLTLRVVPCLSFLVMRAFPKRGLEESFG